MGKCEKMGLTVCAVQEVGQLAEVWEVLHMNLTRSLARAREERRAQAQLEVSGGNVKNCQKGSTTGGDLWTCVLIAIEGSP